MKDLTEVIDLVEGREPGAEGADSRNLAAETPVLRELRESLDALYALAPGLTPETVETMALRLRTLVREAREAGV